ncbi:MAG: hypothetical protein P4L33_17355 [Capsulimonadaceae bacterium]|nr:hypothetical protein [Capsulimonadaceae bacterium]
MKKAFSVILAVTALSLLAAPAHATTKGLNQIVTPDIQPQGALSISYQQQDPNIANPSELQLELGITKRFEIAYFQGFKPTEEIANVEYGLIQSQNFLLSTGFAGYSSRYPHPAPYLEGGYYIGNAGFMLGVEQVQNANVRPGGSTFNQQQTQAILGADYHVSPRLMVQFDYQTGDSNSVTGGFTYAVTPSLSFNPSLYYSNGDPHNYYGYAVLSWTVQVF